MNGPVCSLQPSLPNSALSAATWMTLTPTGFRGSVDNQGSLGWGADSSQEECTSPFEETASKPDYGKWNGVQQPIPILDRVAVQHLQSALFQTATCRTAVQKHSFDHDACLVQSILQQQDKEQKPVSFPVADESEMTGSPGTKYDEVMTPATSPISPSLRGSMLSWVKGKLGFAKPTSPDGSDGLHATLEREHSGDTEVKSPVVLEEILAAPPTAWSRPSFDFRESRTARNALGSNEMLRTSSEPPNVVPRRRRAREFVRPRNTDFYKDMAEAEERAPKRRSTSLTDSALESEPVRSSGETERKLMESRDAAVQRAFQLAHAHASASDSHELMWPRYEDFLPTELVERVSTYHAPVTAPCNISQSAFFQPAPPEHFMGSYDEP